MIWLLILLGIVTYFIVQRVTGITRTPVWMLWLVAMTPAIILNTWALVYRDKPIPPILVIGLFISCLLLYWSLIQWGRIPNPSAADSSTTQKDNQTPTNPADVKSEPVPLRPIDKAEEASLQSCFPWSIYYLQNIEYRPQAVICRGQLKTTPEVAYKTVAENIERYFGDRFYVVFQEGQSGKPFFALVPNALSQRSQRQLDKSLNRPVMALGLFVFSILTSTLVGVEVAGVSNQQLQNDPSLLLRGLPYAIALVTFFGLWELARYLTARAHRLPTTLPYFIPFPFFIGTWAFLQIRAPMPNRKALFDVGIAGPILSLVATLSFLVWGLAHSTVVPISDKAALNLQALNPNFSIFIALLSKLVLGNELVARTAIELHPVAVAGLTGLLLTAFRLMPVGQLDGGHIVHAMFGQRIGAAIGQVTRLLVLALSLIQPDLLLLAIILFLIPVNDEPALNDVTELDNPRDLSGLLVLGFVLLVILPAPRLVTNLLGL